MAMRRRIKVVANLAKRKPKVEPNESQPFDKASIEEEPKEQIAKSEISSTTTTTPPTTKIEIKPVVNADDTAFKCPLKVEFNRSNSHSNTHTLPSEEFPQTDIDDGAQVMQMDLQRTSNGFPMSPSKVQRQRIKPTPIFGQRRNSFVGPPPSPLANEDLAEHTALPQRRERHYSGSFNNLTTTTTGNQSPMKLPNLSSGRVRTESSCSAFSDSHLSMTSKSRKTDDHASQRNQTRRDFEARFSNGVPEKSSLKMFDLIYYNPVTNPMEQKPKVDEIKVEAIEQETKTEPDIKNHDNSAVPVPQLKLNAKGELILDDKSLEIETTAEQEARKVLAKSSLIYLDENTGMNGFYKRHKRTKDWLPDETIRFYRCLQTIGTDFSLMCQLFPKRTRRDLKLKFKKEERCNGALINKALLHPNSFNIQDLKDQFDNEDKEKEEARNKAKKILEYKKVHVKTSKSARALKNAEDIYNFEFNDGEKLRPAKRKRTPKTVPKDTLNNIEAPKEKKKRQSRKIKTETRETEPAPSFIKAEPVENQNQLQYKSFLETTTPYPLHISATNETMITPDDATMEEEFIELLSVATSEEHNEFIYEANNDLQSETNEDVFTETTRTFVNLDSGDVTLIEDNIEPTSCSNINDNLTATLTNHGDKLNSDEYVVSLPMVLNDKDIDNDIGYDIDIGNDHDIGNDNDSPLQQQKTELYCSSDVSQSHRKLSVGTEDNVGTELRESIEQQLELVNSNETDTILNITPDADFSDEKTIQRILEDIANGSLVVVSSLDPLSPEEHINEIYQLDRSTGELYDEPLDLPSELVQSILSVMT